MKINERLYKTFNTLFRILFVGTLLFMPVTSVLAAPSKPSITGSQYVGRDQEYSVYGVIQDHNDFRLEWDPATSKIRFGVSEQLITGGSLALDGDKASFDVRVINENATPYTEGTHSNSAQKKFTGQSAIKLMWNENGGEYPWDVMDFPITGTPLMTFYFVPTYWGKTNNSAGLTLKPNYLNMYTIKDNTMVQVPNNPAISRAVNQLYGMYTDVNLTTVKESSAINEALFSEFKPNIDTLATSDEISQSVQPAIENLFYRAANSYYTQRVNDLFVAGETTVKEATTQVQLKEMVTKVTNYTSGDTQAELLGKLNNALKLFGNNEVYVTYTTKTEVSDPENPDSPSYALQLPSGFQFTQENEPLPGASEGTGIDGVFKLVNPTDNTTYTGTKAVKLSVSSANTWKLKTADSAAVLGADYTLKDGETDATTATYSFNLDQTTSEKTLSAYLKGKADKSGNYSDVLTFTYENVAL